MTLGDVSRRRSSKRKRDEKRRLGLCVHPSCNNKPVKGRDSCEYHLEYKRNLDKKIKDGTHIPKSKEKKPQKVIKRNCECCGKELKLVMTSQKYCNNCSIYLRSLLRENKALRRKLA
ncbi:unnamed protein product [marine sediment metagenome]|uniref:RTR1-type domain-containing protein n=1 Tax=marine sediment metagenome TaxID=412755 RepID=X0VVF6_9ZZZZ